MLSEATTIGVLWRKVFIEIWENSQENTYARASFSIKLQVWGLPLYQKRRLWHRCFPVTFAKFIRTRFLQNTSWRLPLCFMAFRDWRLLPQRFKNICCWKIDCGKHSGADTGFRKRGGTSNSGRKTAGGFKMRCKPSKWVWGKAPKAFAIQAFTSTRIANIHVVIRSDFAL